MKLASYWIDTTPPIDGLATGSVDNSADVVIVGAGLTGLSAALSLSKRGAKVTVLEARKVGQAASGRNGGMCNNGFAQDYAKLSEAFGRERAIALYKSFDAGVDTVERLIVEENISCSFQRYGKLKLAAKPEHYEKLVRAQELLARDVDPQTRIIPAFEIRSEIGADCYYGGLLYEKSAGMHVGRFAHGLAEAAIRNGVRIFENAPALRFDRNSASSIDVSTPLGKVRGQQVLLSSGISNFGPLSWFRRRIVPVGAFIIVTEPLPIELLDRLTPNRRMTVDTKNFVNYFRVTPDNRLLFGGRARFATSNPRSDVKSGRILHKALLEIFPELASFKIDYCWGGMVDMTRDRLPRAGMHNGMHYSMGYSGHGTQMSTYMGTVMADIIGGNPDRNPWRDFAWPAIPGHFGKPWFLPAVGAYFRVKDMLS